MEDAVAEAYAADLGVPVARWHVTERLHILRYDTGDRNDVATSVTLGLSALVVTQNRASSARSSFSSATGASPENTGFPR
jgi:hypothetical protein